MARIPAHIIDEIMTTARIEEVIGEYVQLKKAGSNFKGLSPFVDEKTPSFMVSPAKQIFKDFSSGKGGTVVSFLMEIEQFSYVEALKWLANRYNISLPEERPLTPEEVLELSERESLQIVNDFARDFFVNTIHNSQEGKTIGYSYFKERGFTPDIIEKFQLGYCPREEKSLTDTALEKGYELKYLEQLGLTKSKDNRTFDFFSGRVIFPIHSVSGKVLGFGGRTLFTDKKVAKYFNSPESILYDKSRILYGMFFAKNEILKHDNCLLVEGYTDVISMFQAGVENVVSSSGTSLTTGQIKLIQRYTQNITVLFDSDAAGIKASFRGIDMLLEAGMNVKVLMFPDGEDPDSFAQRVSSEELKKYIATQQQDFIGFKTGILLEDAGNNPIQRASLIKEIVNSISLIPDSITRSVYLKETALQFDMDEQILLNELNKIRRQKQSTSPAIDKTSPLTELSTTKSASKKPEENNFYEKEFDVIRILILFGDLAIEIENSEAKDNSVVEISVAELIVQEIERDGISFEHTIFQDIFDNYKKELENGRFYDATVLLRQPNQELVQFITDIISPKYELSPNWVKNYNIYTVAEEHNLSLAVKQTIYSFKIIAVKRKLLKIQEQLKYEQDLDEDVIMKLLNEQHVLQLVRVRLGEQIGRQ